jgi:hypothetical protein
MNRKKPRSYTYRVPLDDKKALRKIHRLQAIGGWIINKIHKNNVPNGKAVRHWDVIFYESTEYRDLETDELIGGTIPGLGNYQYSFDWEPTPETEMLEMRNANQGGTRIKGEQFVGTSDPRLSDYVPVDTVVPWTPTEIKAMFDGESVPDKLNYRRNPPELNAKEALEKYHLEIQAAIREGIEEQDRRLIEYVENCDHSHVVDLQDDHDAGYCEDCGHVWHDNEEMQAAVENGEASIVGLA